MPNRLIKFFVINLIVWPSVLAALVVQAASKLGGLDETAGQTGYDTAQSSDAIGYIIGLILSGLMAIIGIVFMVLIILGGFDILNAGGDEQKVTEGKNKIKNGAIGMLIIFVAYVISRLMVEFFLKKTINI